VSTNAISRLFILSDLVRCSRQSFLRVCSLQFILLVNINSICGSDSVKPVDDDAASII
jgi:hypothetical protein